MQKEKILLRKSWGVYFNHKRCTILKILLYLKTIIFTHRFFEVSPKPMNNCTNLLTLKTVLFLCCQQRLKATRIRKKKTAMYLKADALYRLAFS